MQHKSTPLKSNLSTVYYCWRSGSEYSIIFFSCFTAWVQAVTISVGCSGKLKTRRGKKYLISCVHWAPRSTCETHSGHREKVVLIAVTQNDNYGFFRLPSRKALKPPSPYTHLSHTSSLDSPSGLYWNPLFTATVIISYCKADEQ